MRYQRESPFRKRGARRAHARARRQFAGVPLKLLIANWQDRENPLAGGAEIHLHEVFGRLARRHDVTLLVSGFDGAPRTTTLDGMHVLRTGSRHTYNLTAPVAYKRHLKHQNFDLFIEDLNKVPIFSPLWAGVPVVTLVHHLFGSTAFQEASLPFAAATWLLERPLPWFYRDLPTVAVSESTAVDLVARGFDTRQIRVIENGVDLAHYSPGDGARFPVPTVLYLGRLKRYKRVDLIVRAFVQVRKQVPTAKLIIAGTGDAAPEIRRLTVELGIEDAVEMPGFVPEERKLELMRGAWVHALTSPKEGWGIANLEAAACGTATVASDSPGLRDSVRDGVTGFLVPHGELAALAERMTIILRDSGLRDRLGSAARSFALEYSWDNAATRMEQFLESVRRSQAK